jgi:hypothetical protein
MKESQIEEYKKTRKNIRKRAVVLIRKGKNLDNKELEKLFDLQDLFTAKIKELT